MRTLSFLALACSVHSFAQSGKAELFGVVRDPAALPIPNAAVRAENQDTDAHFATVTGARGEFHLLGLPAGQYVLRVEQTGFRPYRRSGIRLRISEQVSLDIALEIGAPETEAV